MCGLAVTGRSCAQGGNDQESLTGLLCPSLNHRATLLTSKVGSNLHQLVQFRGGRAAVEEPELTGLFHLADGFDETGHRRAVQ